MNATNENKLLIIAAFFAIYFVWGTSYLAVAIALRGFPPFLLSALRFTIAGVLMLLYAFITKQQFPTGKILRVSLISGVLMLVGGSGLVTWAEQYVLSGHAAVVTATEPFFFVLLDRKRWSFYFSHRKIIIGLLTGFAGVVIFITCSSPTESSVVDGSLLAAGYFVLLVSCVLWVAGSLYAPHHQEDKSSRVATVAMQLIGGGLVSFVLALMSNELHGFTFQQVSAEAWAGLAYVIFFASIIAYQAFHWLMAIRPPAQVSTHTYVNPIIAVLLGWWMINEPINAIQIIGIIIILIGVLLTNSIKNNE